MAYIDKVLGYMYGISTDYDQSIGYRREVLTQVFVNHVQPFITETTDFTHASVDGTGDDFTLYLGEYVIEGQCIWGDEHQDIHWNNAIVHRVIK